MQTSHLRAFITVAECASFSRAAELLFLTQSAISKRIASLEQELKCRLFDRIGHKVSLTESGQTLLPRAHQIITQVEESRREIQNLSGEIVGEVSLGTSHHIGLNRMPTLLKKYHDNYPDVEMNLQFMESEAVYEAVSQGKLEMGVVTLPLQPQEHLQQYEIWQDPLYFVVNKEHPFASQRTVTEKQLTQYTAILPTKETNTFQLLASQLQQQHIALHKTMNTNNLDTIKMLVSIGLGWSLLPQTLIDDELHCFEVAGVHVSRKLGIVIHRQRTLSNAAKAMIALLQQQVNVHESPTKQPQKPPY